MPGRGGAWTAALAAAASVVAVDQAAKAWVRSSLAVNERRNGLAVLDLVRVNNKGVAFGALGGQGWLVPALAAAATAGVLLWFWRHADVPFAWLPAGLVLGGAIGNFIDRIVSGQVTDFVKLPHWPAFNVADIAITCGVILLVVVAELDSRRSDAADRS